MNIELAKSEEIVEVNKIAKQVHDLHVNWRPDIFKRIEQVIPKERFKELIKNNEIFIAKEEGKIVGYAIIKIKEINDIPGLYDRKILDLDAICIDKEYRNKGIGTKLIKYLIDIGKKQNCTDLYLTVNEENTNAIKVYKNLGMKVKNIKYSMKI